MTSTPSLSATDPNSSEEWLPVGQLVGAQGLRGELRLNPASDFPERFTEPGPRWLQAKGSPLKEVELLEGRQLPGKSIYVVRLKGVNSRALKTKIQIIDARHQKRFSGKAPEPRVNLRSGHIPN